MRHIFNITVKVLPLVLEVSKFFLVSLYDFSTLISSIDFIYRSIYFAFAFTNLHRFRPEFRFFFFALIFTSRSRSIMRIPSCLFFNIFKLFAICKNVYYFVIYSVDILRM